MNQAPSLVVFRLDAQRYALELGVVERVIRAVEVTPLPSAPYIVLGVIDFAGRILPVLNLRRRLRLPERELMPADQFVVARTASRSVVLVVDEALEVIEHEHGDLIESHEITPGLEYVQGIVQLKDGLVFIHDLESFLSVDESRRLDAALLRSQP